ncbi:metallophosphoesterase [Paenibacillus sp. MZ04-78.2]|uniref:metallophosphoesterase n=1 Tax=Paenibacillus sp. MZ04-78.2 TaxID=2962034 RepID=UPI0020B68888|nr:metallophosphoesterase [Paenibacillus sp. MZ04-78.2]MCP3775247.1 metallophosphoesterase [Paenibacillus sp. MZ04-78.2]
MDFNESNLNTKLSRRSFLKTLTLTAAGLIALPGATYGYARYAEPKWLEVTEYTLSFARLPQQMDGIKVVQFSDVHLGFHFDTKDLSELIGLINRIQPDIVCFTGDLVDHTVGPDGDAYARVLSELKPPLGKYAVLGNHDFKEPRQVRSLLKSAAFELLTNKMVRIQHQGSSMVMAGVDDQWKGNPDIDKALARVKPEDFVILLSHCPDFADIAVRYSVDFQLSGHSHGGQVRLPFYGHVMTPKFGRKYVLGHYVLGAGKLQLFVNRGIGVSTHPVRFLCRPELTVFTLRKG